MTSESIYVLSDPDASKLNKYKVGITTRNKSKLLRDYRRSRPEVELYLFEKCEKSKLIEESILKQFKDNRISHESGNPSEWLIVDLQILLKAVKSELSRSYTKLEIVKMDTYKIEDFIRDNCTLKFTTSESCQNLYQIYITVHLELNKLNYLNFCRSVTQFLVKHYGKESKDLKYKYNKLIYYRGISINGAGYSYCNIL